MTEKPTDSNKPKAAGTKKPEKKQKPVKQSSAKAGAKTAANGAKQEGAYLVLARKYRPRNFDELIGQDAMIQTLANAFASGRIAQAYMLSGVRGVGKTTTARILARALNYQTKSVNEPTIAIEEEGDHCRAIMEGNHVDVIEMDAASHTGIDDIREIIEAARYKPVSGRYKVYIIDEVHMLSKSAFNGLLKTLEEPPEHVKFIFATTELRKVPVTVLSRCQRFDLRRVSMETLEAHFARIADAEGVGIEDEAVKLVARAAEGSVRDGLSLLDQVFARSPDSKITIGDVRDMLGLADETEVLALLTDIFSGNAKQAMATFRGFYNEGADPQQLIAELAAAVHAITGEKVLSDKAALETHPEAAQKQISELAATMSHAVLHRAWQALLKGYDEVATAPCQQSAAEMLLLRLLYMGELPGPGDLTTAIKQLQQGGKPGQNAAPGKTPLGNNETAHAPECVESNEHKTGNITHLKERRHGAAAEALSLNPQPADQPHQQPQEQPQEQPVRDADEQPRPEPLQAQANNKGPTITSFADLVTLLRERREVKLKWQLEEFAELVNFAPGRVELHMLQGADDGFIAELSSKLSNWTGTRWMVALSHERGQPTIASQRREKEQQELAQIKAHPKIEAVLKTFPGAEISAIKPIKPEDD